MKKDNRHSISALRAGCGIATLIAVALAAPAFAAAGDDKTTVAPTQAEPSTDSTAANGQLQEIVVTAQHRSENLRQVPIAVNAISGDALKNVGISDTSSLVQAVPSLSFSRSGPSGIFVIRGVATPNGAAGEEGSTAVYVDDVYQPDLASTVNTFNNIERIEVLNGPQGTLFGRNATGGLIRIITKDPSNHTEFDGQVGYANYGTFSGQAYASTPLSDKIGVNFAVTGQNQSKGYGYNPTINSDVRTNDYWGVRSKAVLRPTETLKITLGGDYYSTNDTTAVNVWPIAVDATTGVATSTPASQDSQAGYPSFTHIRAWGGSAKGELDLGAVNLTSISAYRKLTNSSSFDIDGSAPDLYHLFYTNSVESFQQELRLASASSNPLSWQLGAFYLHTITNVNQQQGGAALRGAIVNIVDKGVTDSYSVFGEATYTLTPTTHLTGGVRYTSDHRKLPSGYQDTLIGTTVVAHATNPLDHATYNNVTFRAAVRQDLTDQINLYASFNKGFKSGEFNLQVPQNAPVKPETIMAYEGGIKGDLFDRHLRVTISGFHYDIKDYQVRTTIGTVTALFNAAKVKIDGADLIAEAAVTRAFHLNIGASYVDARYDQFGGPGTGVIAPGKYPASDPGNATGHKTPLAPKFTFTLGGTYVVPLGGASDLRLTASYAHKSKVYFEPDNALVQPGYGLANLSVEYNLNAHLGLELFVKNVGNKLYNVQENTAIGAYGVAGLPRQYGANLKYHF